MNNKKCRVNDQGTESQSYFFSRNTELDWKKRIEDGNPPTEDEVSDATDVLDVLVRRKAVNLMVVVAFLLTGLLALVMLPLAYPVAPRFFLPIFVIIVILLFYYVGSLDKTKRERDGLMASDDQGVRELRPLEQLVKASLRVQEYTYKLGKMGREITCIEAHLLINLHNEEINDDNVLNLKNNIYGTHGTQATHE